ncbi:MAG: HEAT repeat domain-containing protein [Planctomycetota bacterium]|nr:MAG: HEAT repeat domain-containing protein [Planctomycetota bacterium]
MLIPLLLVLCTCLPDEKPAPVDAARVKATVETLDKAFGEKPGDRGTPEARLAAIESAREVVDAAVIEALARGLKRKDEPAVRSATVEALRTMRHPKAFEALLDFAKQSTTQKDEKLYPSVLRAVASHGDKRAIPLLRDGALGAAPYKVDEARIYGLGNIRDADSVEALIGLMNTLGPHKIAPFMNEISLALSVLTGAEGQRYEDWQRWWNDNKKKLEIAPQLPELPKGKLVKWHLYWGMGKDELKQKLGEKGGDKGDDKPDGEPKPPAKKG